MNTHTITMSATFVYLSRRWRCVDPPPDPAPFL